MFAKITFNQHIWRFKFALFFLDNRIIDIEFITKHTWTNFESSDPMVHYAIYDCAVMMIIRLRP